MSRALTSNKKGYFLNVLLTTNCKFSSLKEVSNDMHKIKDDFAENLDDFEERVEENLEVVESKIEANMTDMKGNLDKAKDSIMTKFVRKLWTLGYIIGTIALVALLIAFAFGCFNVWRHVKLAKQIVTHSNVIDLLRTKFFKS